MAKFYITTAIPYVNAKPHIGFALELIQADVIARWRKAKGDDVWFLTGADENSLKNVQAAEVLKKPTQVFVDEMSEDFRKLVSDLDISTDDFIRTTEVRHKTGAQKFWQMLKPEDVYKKSYVGLYCVGCEQFYLPEELVGGVCPEHKTEPEKVQEENYFFKLSSYQTQLEKLIESDQLKVVPEGRKNEILSFIKHGLDDFSISRSVSRARGWGVAVPGDEKQVMYVWVDALSNYITALGFAEDGDKYQEFWVNNKNTVHVIGKGIIRFHCIYWPALLMSAGLPLPKEIFVHGYITVGNEKMSKSLGNVVSPFALIEKYGTDSLRNYLLREVSAYDDGDYTEEKFRNRYQSDMQNGIGNTLTRLTNMVDQYLGGQLPRQARVKLDQSPIDDALSRYRFDEAINVIWGWFKNIDQAIDQHKPWELAKKNKTAEVSKLLDVWCEMLYQAGRALEPFLPKTATLIKESLSGNKIVKINPPFPKIN